MTAVPAPRLSSRTALATALATLCTSGVWAQAQVVKPPIAQYWMDVATLSMAGMDDMPDMGAMGGLGGLFGGPPGAKPTGPGFGQTRGMMPGRWLDLAVYTQQKPAGTQATQAIPPGQAMGASLVLLPPVKEAAKAMPQLPSTPETVEKDEVPEQPKGRVLLYWGCGDTVRPGQPKVLDFATASFQDYGTFMAGRSDRERGATAAPGHAVWPNPQHSQKVPKDASLTGTHAVSGDGIPANLQFAIGQAQDFMPKLALTAQGGGAAATLLQWPALAHARAYFFNAMGSSGHDMVIWSSADVPEPGWGLINYASNANVDKWLAEKVLLPHTQTQCAIPAGVFAQADSGMVQGIAYGNELNLAHPPRPADRKLPWAPEWTARIRVKSAAMLSLEGDGRSRRAPGRADQHPLPTDAHATHGAPDAATGTGQPDSAPPPSPNTPPKLPGMPELGNVLKGLFGR